MALVGGGSNPLPHPINIYFGPVVQSGRTLPGSNPGGTTTGKLFLKACGGVDPSGAGSGLENQQRVKSASEFESPSLRHILKKS